MRIDLSDTYVDETQRLLHDDAPFTGEAELRGEHGELLELGTYHEGLKHGLQQQWYPDGRKKTEGVSKMGTAIGDWYQWHPNGQLAMHRVFADNGWPKHVRKWDAQGNLLQDKRLS